jgi:type VI secretion system secreted protein Hcp
MARMAYLQLTGQKQGKIKGDITVTGRVGTIGVIAVTHSIVSPRDASTGMPTGKRIHKPLTLTKEIDQSSPMLLQALVTNENLTMTKLDFYATNAAGVEKNCYRIELVNASVSSYEVHQGNIRDTAMVNRAVWEDVSFTYQKITWTWLEGTTISADDDWMEPSV